MEEEAMAYRDTLLALESQPPALPPAPEPWWQSLVTRASCLGKRR